MNKFKIKSISPAVSVFNIELESDDGRTVIVQGTDRHIFLIAEDDLSSDGQYEELRNLRIGSEVFYG